MKNVKRNIKKEKRCFSIKLLAWIFHNERCSQNVLDWTGHGQHNLTLHRPLIRSVLFQRLIHLLGDTLQLFVRYGYNFNHTSS